MRLADGVPAGHTDGLKRNALTSSHPPSPLCQEQAPRDQPESPAIQDTRAQVGLGVPSLSGLMTWLI